MQWMTPLGRQRNSEQGSSESSEILTDLLGIKEIWTEILEPSKVWLMTINRYWVLIIWWLPSAIWWGGMVSAGDWTPGDYQLSNGGNFCWILLRIRLSGDFTYLLVNYLLIVAEGYLSGKDGTLLGIDTWWPPTVSVIFERDLWLAGDEHPAAGDNHLVTTNCDLISGVILTLAGKKQSSEIQLW